MVVTEIVEGTHDIYGGSQGLALLSQGACASSEPGEALAEGGVEPFNEGGVDDPAFLPNPITRARATATRPRFGGPAAGCGHCGRFG